MAPGAAAIEANAWQYMLAVNEPWENRLPGILQIADGMMRTGEQHKAGAGAAAYFGATSTFNPCAANQGVKFERQPASLDSGILFGQRACFLNGTHFENEHAAEVAIIAERACNDQLAGFGHLAKIRKVTLLDALALFLRAGSPIRAFPEKADYVGGHLNRGRIRRARTLYLTVARSCPKA